MLEAIKRVFFVLYAFILKEQKFKHTLRRMLKVSIRSVMPIQTEARGPSDSECNFQKRFDIIIIMVRDLLLIKKSVELCGRIDLSKLSKSFQSNFTFHIYLLLTENSIINPHDFLLWKTKEDILKYF